MAGINGTVAIGIAPRTYDTNDLMDMTRHEYRGAVVHSANEPLRYSIVWNHLNENTEASKDGYSNNNGDVINVIFDIYAAPQYYGFAMPNEWLKVASIKKARDITNRYHNPSNQSYSKASHRFTIDISQICQDLLSYSLVPIGKGTWESAEWGGMNGGIMIQDNVAEHTSKWNFGWNGTSAAIYVRTRYEIIKSDGSIIEATTQKDFRQITVMNTVEQFDDPTYSAYYNHKYEIQHWGSSATYPRKFMSNCLNQIHQYDKLPPVMKMARENDKAEWLYWFQYRTYQQSAWTSGSASPDLYSKYRLKIRTSDGNVGYLDDFSNTLRKATVNAVTAGGDTSNDYVFHRGQLRVCVQNVSLWYIKNNAKDASDAPYNPITTSTEWYSIQVSGLNWQSGAEGHHSAISYYSIDRETEHKYGYVRFHWLNRAGGIDSYTAKRDITEGINVSRETIERKDGDRKHTQGSTYGSNAASSAPYYNDSMRGGDSYKGGVEVLSVNATRVSSVYTEPLPKQTAKWLEELITSPNVWIETAMTRVMAGSDYYDRYRTIYQDELRPVDIEYSPVIITNSDIETVNASEGLVKLNIEYTHSHKLNIQRN